MHGLMQNQQLLVSSLIEHAGRYHPNTEIISQTCEGREIRSDYKTLGQRARKLAKALLALGVKPGDRVATLAWNTHRHIELYFAVSGIGAILHTVNPRLFPEQISYILGHAESSVLFYDITFHSLIKELRPNLRNVAGIIAMTDQEHMPETSQDVLCYETLLAAESDHFQWPALDEREASSLCYTSGTTGDPKGVLYSHRSTVLHAMMLCQVDGLQVSSSDSILLNVPLFHVNGWGIPYAAAICGAKLVLPGPNLDGRNLYKLAVAKDCTLSLGVPTVWFGLLDYIDTLDETGKAKLPLKRAVLGGAASPRSLLKRLSDLGIDGRPAWGMTETSPVAAVANPLKRHAGFDQDAMIDRKSGGGRPVYGVELRLVDDNGNVLPADGVTPGFLQVRGLWVTSGYYGKDGRVPDADNWFDTGDIAVIDDEGYVCITDRSKDVIKSGGEWISSIELENAAVAHPDVAEAAVIGIHHPKWQERPLLIVVPKQGKRPDPGELRDFLAAHVVKWWLPDDVAFVETLPRTATGKIQKLELREQFAGYVAGETNRQDASRRDE